jgi:hypothetical protein
MRILDMIAYKHTPYEEKTLEALLAEIKSNDEYIKQHSEQLDWAEENDHDSGIIDALREGLDHAVADWNWMRQEMFNRGFQHDSKTDTWKLSS